MEFIRIVLASVAAAVLYGIVHDQVTVRVCLEYFTVGHPKLVETTSPTLLALFWGVVATWWVGLPLGFLLASAAQNGRRWPKLGLRRILPRLAWLLAVLFAFAAVAGGAMFLLVEPLGLELPPHLAEAVPPAVHRAFLAAWAAHVASYLGGLVGGLAVATSVLRERRRSENQRHPAP